MLVKQGQIVSLSDEINPGLSFFFLEDYFTCIFGEDISLLL